MPYRETTEAAEGLPLDQVVHTYYARRRLKMGPDEYRDPPEKGQRVTAEHLIPEAHLWTRTNSFEHTGYIHEIDATPDEVNTALELRSVGETDQDRIRDLLGMTEGVLLNGEQRTPFTRGVEPKALPEQKQTTPRAHGGPVPQRPDRKRAAPKKAPVKKAPTKKVASKTVARKSTTPVLIPLRELDED